MDISDVTAWFFRFGRHLSDKQKDCDEVIKIKDVCFGERRLRIFGFKPKQITFRWRSTTYSIGDTNWFAVGWCFVHFDEPSIGLHQRDNEIDSFFGTIRDIGNSVIVVEHDKRYDCRLRD
jgi:hypothetical protein